MNQICFIITVYNAEKYLHKCLDSIFSQTKQNISVIVVDDGSTDSSYQIIQEYERKFERGFYVFKQANAGDGYSAGPARNRGLSELFLLTAPSEYKNTFVSFVDSDDWLEHGAIDHMQSSLQNYAPEIVLFNYYFHSLNDKTETSGFSGDSLDNTLDRLINSSKTPWAKLFRLDLLKDIHFPKIVHEDIQIIPILLEKAKKIKYVPYSVYNYCSRQLSNSRSIDFHMKPDILIAILSLIKHSRENDIYNLKLFALSFYCDILIEYKNKTLTDYNLFDHYSQLIIQMISKSDFLVLQDMLIKRIQFMPKS
jgi:CDP-ribitol ribitolphosphotransferase